LRVSDIGFTSGQKASPAEHCRPGPLVTGSRSRARRPARCRYRAAPA
jgi:hypothetical protein